MSPDRLYGISWGEKTVVVSSISSGPHLGALQTLMPSRASSLFVSAGRAITVDTNGVTALWDRGQQTSTMSVPGASTESLSGSWYLIHKDGTGNPWLMSLGGAAVDLTSYTSVVVSATTETDQFIVGHVGSLFSVEKSVWNSSTSALQSLQLTVRDAANGGAIVMNPVTVPKPTVNSWLGSCWMNVGEIDCSWWNRDASSNLVSLAVTRVNYVSGTTSTVTIPLPAGETGGGVDAVNDGIAMCGWYGATASMYAYNLANVSTSQQVDGESVVAKSGNMVAVETGSTSSVVHVTQLPFGGGSVPTLIGVVGSHGSASVSSPFTLQLDFSKPVGAGVLTITNPSGHAVADLNTPASSDGSLRGLSWTPASSDVAGTYTWSLSVQDSLGQSAVANVGKGTPMGTFTVGAPGPTPGSFTQLSGADRYGTAIAIAQDGWKGGADTVVLAVGANFPDALAGTPLAAALNAPILLTRTTDSVPADVMAEILALGAKNVVLLGSATVIPAAQEASLVSAGFKVKRLAGATRYDTAAAISVALESGSLFGVSWTPSKDMILVTGTNYPDALAMGSYAGMHLMPIMFSTATDLPAQTVSFIRSYGVKKVYAVGAARTDAILAGVRSAGVPSSGVTLLYGSDRYETASVIASSLFGTTGVPGVSVAVGNNFPDALTGAVLSSKWGMPLLLLKPGSGASASEKSYVGKLSNPAVYAFGGTNVMTPGMVSSLLSNVKMVTG